MENASAMHDSWFEILLKDKTTSRRRDIATLDGGQRDLPRQTRKVVAVNRPLIAGIKVLRMGDAIGHGGHIVLCMQKGCAGSSKSMRRQDAWQRRHAHER